MAHICTVVVKSQAALLRCCINYRLEPGVKPHRVREIARVGHSSRRKCRAPARYCCSWHAVVGRHVCDVRRHPGVERCGAQEREEKYYVSESELHCEIGSKTKKFRSIFASGDKVRVKFPAKRTRFNVQHGCPVQQIKCRQFNAPTVDLFDSC